MLWVEYVSSPGNAILLPFTVATMAEECGFSSVYHFCRSFRQRAGQTPTQYAVEYKIYPI